MLLWTLVGVIGGAQASLAGALQGKPVALGPAVLDSLHQSLAWVPATLLGVALATRFTLTRSNWKRRIWIHLAAVPLAALATNVLVVAVYWARAQAFGGLLVLLRQGALWGAVRLHLALVVYGASVAVTQSVQYWRGLRRRELELARLEGQLANARLQALNAQIRPHFLFNTLHAIGQLWRSGRNDQADALLDHLGALFQRVIASTSRREVLLAEELEMVRQYLAIEQVRFGERMRSRVEAGESALRCLVPPLILQPLVENAVKHGVSRSLEDGALSVEARVEGARLVLLVRDNGPGPQGPADTSGMGTGLANVRERLTGMYGEHCSFESSGGPRSGTDVRLSIPARHEA